MLERKSRFLTSRLRKGSGWKIAGQAPPLPPFSVKQHFPFPAALALARPLDPVLERRVVRVLGAAGGADRLRLVRQLLTETALLAALGGGLGLLFAYWGKAVLLALLMGKSDELAVTVRLDWRVLGFTAAVTLLTGLFFGLVPTLRTTRIELTPMLKENPGSVGPAGWEEA